MITTSVKNLTEIIKYNENEIKIAQTSTLHIYKALLNKLESIISGISVATLPSVATLEKASFSLATLEQASFSVATLEQASFSVATL